ncbi:MAG: exo-alpha-sialidase, partial [Alloprevotella sp.]|nr:exo-alpha-sialidase [Alloprevotella sp.]
RESGEVLMMCAAGSTGMGASTASNPIKVGQVRSSDNGRTWDDGQDVTSAIYGLYSGNATALFITSGSL